MNLKDKTPTKKMTPEEEAILLNAAVLEVVPLPAGYGLAVDVTDDEDSAIVERQYFTFDNVEDANSFRALIKSGFH